MKPMKRSQRALVGAVCLIVVALVMGWFVGRYIPGEPYEPEPRLGEGLYSETGYPANKVVDTESGSTMQLRDITQGMHYHGRPQEVAQKSESEINNWKEIGEWEYDCPNIDVSVASIKAITTASFAEWYPEYKSQWDRVYNNSKLLAVTASITNTSDEPITSEHQLPHFMLWSENFDNLDGSLGEGAYLDGGSFYLANEPTAAYNPTSEEHRDEGRYINLQPGESQELVLPFKVNKNNLIDQSAFDKLDPSEFCLQVADYDTGTAYRLWL